MAADGTEIFSVPLLPGGIKENLRRRTEMVLGKKTFAGMKEIDFEGFGIKIHGFVSLMDAFCSTRANQYYFVNRRPVASQMLKQAFYKAYPAVPMGKHPSCVLFLELDPSEFDVNVHPQKRDVKFSREGDIFRAFEDALKQATENIAGMEKIPPGGIYGRGIPPSVRYRMPEQQSSGSDFTFVSDNSAADIAISADSLPENGNFRPISPEDIPGVSKGVKNFHGGLSAKAAFGLCPSEVNEAISNAGANYSNPPLFSDRLRNLPPAVPEDPAQAWKTAELKYIGQLADSYLLLSATGDCLPLTSTPHRKEFSLKNILMNLPAER